MNIFLPDRLPQEFFLLNYLILTEPRVFSPVFHETAPMSAIIAEIGAVG